MAGGSSGFSAETFWLIFGTAGLCIFYGRFYVQWLVSERRGESVIPIAFWYMSGVGSIMQFIYAVYLISPGAAFGYCFNIVIYTRNLVHIWRERGRLTKRLAYVAHGIAALIAAIAVGFMLMTWRWEYHANRALDPAQAAQNWFWLKVWGVGQVMFFLRFFIQWLTTEYKRKSVVPAAFWYLSLGASVLQFPSFVQRHDWVFAAGMLTTMPIYARNIFLIHRKARRDAAAPGEAAEA